MNIDLATLRQILIWSTVVNYAFLTIWFLVIAFAHDWVMRLHGKWFGLSRENFDTVHYGGMALYKIAIMLLCVGPLIGVVVAS